jgi:DNA-binding Lrp family transcriptional regulator
LAADRLEHYRSNFVGVNPKFLDCISDGLKVSERYAKLLDYIQYNNPPFNQHRIEDELGIPQPSISRTLSRLRNEGDTRIRQDINFNKVALKTIFIFYDSILLPIVPAVDWVTSGWWTSNGTLLIYRVPPEYENKLIDMISETLGEPSEVVRVKSTFMAKPSIEYYFTKIETLNPITAIEALEKHPPVPRTMIEFPDPEVTLKYKDPKALELLAYLEYDIEEARRVFSKKWGFKQYRLQISKISSILKGARVMFLDKDVNINTLIFARIGSSRPCSTYIAKTIAIYPYATNISLTDEDELIVAFFMPFGYWKDVAKWMLNLCGQGTIRFKTHIATLNGGLIRQAVPWRNLNRDTGYWGFDEVPKLELTRVVRGAKTPGEALKLYEWDVRTYVENLIKTMGVSYVTNLATQLPLDVRKTVENALNQILTGNTNP